MLPLGPEHGNEMRNGNGGFGCPNGGKGRGKKGRGEKGRRGEGEKGGEGEMGEGERGRGQVLQPSLRFRSEEAVEIHKAELPAWRICRTSWDLHSKHP